MLWRAVWNITKFLLFSFMFTIGFALALVVVYVTVSAIQNPVYWQINASSVVELFFLTFASAFLMTWSYRRSWPMFNHLMERLKQIA